MSDNEKNPAFMSDEERREEWGEVCTYCGYREDHHPIEYADPEKSGILCDDPKIEGSDDE